MRLRLRLLLMLLRALFAARFGGRLGLLDASVLRLAVLPNDIDVLHVTNDRYHAYMDLGRIDLAVRCGMLGPMLRGRWAPVVGFMSMRYRYPARLFQRVELHTRALWWDEEWIWFEQTFRRRGRILAQGYCKAGLRDGRGVVPTAALRRAIGREDAVSPPADDRIRQLEAVEAMQRRLCSEA